jgi:hypothetical protein
VTPEDRGEVSEDLNSLNLAIALIVESGLGHTCAFATTADSITITFFDTQGREFLARLIAGIAVDMQENTPDKETTKSIPQEPNFIAPCTCNYPTPGHHHPSCKLFHP